MRELIYLFNKCMKMNNKDTQVINATNFVANKYGLKVDWEKTDLENRVLEINDIGKSQEVIQQFCRELAEVLDGILSDNLNNNG